MFLEVYSDKDEKGLICGFWKFVFFQYILHKVKFLED